MRRTASTPNRSRLHGAASVSLFPFLAVLICTMGALILLLVVIARQARLQAAQAARAAKVATAEAAGKQEDVEVEREMVQWRIEQLQNSYRQTESQLAEARLVLGHVEDHARRLHDQLDRLRAAYRELNRLDGSRRKPDQLEADLAQLTARIAEAEQQLAEARQAAQRRRRSYAVVPYQGPYETHRRPIYVECGARTITVQPEGIVLTEEDFDGPMGPGNPLAAALRAAREYLLTQGDLDPERSGEPYPMLLVRPDGIAAYYAARAAMKSWGSEFGYELIGADWELDFQRADPQLAQVVRRAVETARARQKRLAAAAPRHYLTAPRPRYRVSPGRGGIVLDQGMPGAENSGFHRQELPGGFGSRHGPADGSRPNLVPHSHGKRPEDPGNRGSGREKAEVFGPPQERPESTDGRPGAAARPGQWRPEPQSSAGRSPQGQSGSRLENLATSRGRDWALPDAASGSVPITRPIRIECYPDRLVIVPEKGLGGGTSIPLRLRTEESIDEFVSAVWEHMQSWGIAGQGMYWRPLLNVYVAPSAQQRFDEFSALLENSGLTIERR